MKQLWNQLLTGGIIDRKGEIYMRLAEAKKIYIKAGGKFFTKGTMNFWGSQIASDLYSNRCFITSEFDFTGDNRFYNVRQFSEDYTKIRTVSPFNQLTTKQQAIDLVHNSSKWVKSVY